ncbi:MAG: hypothetical protein JG781_2695 [Peptococcaceae bacterium]|nr:hypothetical protein [Peptococcaceae bacterium]
MKKSIIFLVVGLLLIGIAGTAIAASDSQDTTAQAPVIQTPQSQAPVPPQPGQDFWQQMYAYCHGPNGGVMSQFFGNGYAPQGFSGMMGGYGGMMGGYGYR